MKMVGVILGSCMAHKTNGWSHPWVVLHGPEGCALVSLNMLWGLASGRGCRDASLVYGILQLSVVVEGGRISFVAG